VSLYALKPQFQASLRPIARALAGIGVTANQVTIATVLVSIVVGALVAWLLPDPRGFLLLPVWLFARMAFNAIDGMMAREFGQESRLGAYLNELSDVISDIALYFPFALLPPFSPMWIGVVIVLALLSEYAGVLALLVGAPRRFDGPMGKSDRAFVFGVLGLWAGLGSPLPEWAALALPAMAVALVLTIFNRVKNSLEKGD
jgi:CDP-diacylglycerol--glycerol-3-phosphate 3-phosphatidyltransferase